MRLTLSTGNRTSDVNVTLLSDDVTIADLLREVGLTEPPATVAIDRRPHRTSDLLRLSGLTDGAVIDLGPGSARAEAGAEDGETAQPPVAQLVKIAGEGAGDSIGLDPGRYDLGLGRATASPPPGDGGGDGGGDEDGYGDEDGDGSGDDMSSAPGGGFGAGRLERPSVRVELAAGGQARVTPLAEQAVLVAGRTVGNGGVELDDQVIEVTGDNGSRSMFVVGAVEHRGRQRTISSRPGRVMVLRPPRNRPAPPSTVVKVPEPPAGVPSLQPLSPFALLAPIPMAVAMALLFQNPRMLLMGFFSPLLAIGRFIDGRRRIRKAKARIERELAEKSAELATNIDEVARGTAAWRLASQPHLGELASRVADGDPRVWERRLDHDDFLTSTLGYGSTPLEVTGTDKPYGPLVDLLAGARVHGVPLTAPLGQQAAIGLSGDGRATRALARAMVVEAAVLHGPADLQAAVISSDPFSWSWTKWLPHLTDDQGEVRVATGQESAIRILDQLTPADRPERSPWSKDQAPSSNTLLVLDGDDAIDEFTIRVAEASFANPTLRIIAIASRPDQLPSYCATVVVVDATGHLRVSDPDGRHAELTGVAVMASTTMAERVARRLGRLDDPERSSASGGIPTYAALEELVSTEDLTASDVAHRWQDHLADQRRSRGLGAVVGVTQDGPFGIDIVRDGPHAVVAGTTGSGKSELLRSWIASMASVVSPERVNFVLVDFKGGGAFDVCNDFPHTVGVVTDLDEHLSARALRCLQAELRYRELRLRDAGVSSVEDYWEERPDEPLPRLMLIVDEFATLAQELPEFLTSLVDVAQRGRSLGIHMVLATQRPSGVLDAKIKANTNLRIALRVQDDGDSVDVIGVKAAAELDRRTPGRAMARLGASEIVAFQTALVTVATDRAKRHSIEVAPFGIGETARTTPTAVADPEAPSDLEQLVDAAVGANELLGLTPARVPWPAPLPTALTLSQLAERQLAEHRSAEGQLAAPSTPSASASAAPMASWAVTIGLADLPDDQRQDLFHYDADRGHLLIYGADTAGNTSAAASIVIRLAESLPPEKLHVYAVDFGSGGLAPLDDLAQVAAHVPGNDEERLLRVVDRVEDELAERRSMLSRRGRTAVSPEDALPLVLLVIDNFGALVSACEEAGRLEVPARIGSIIRDGADLGVVVIATSSGERGIPMRVAGQVTEKLVFRLADANGYTTFGLRAREVPELGPGRAIDIASGTEVQIAQPSDEGLAVDVARVNESLPERLVAGQPGDDRTGWPQPVEILPDAVDTMGVVEYSVDHGDRWQLAIAIGFDDLHPTGLLLRRGQHAIVSGPAGSGRTTTLLTCALAARASDPGCRLLGIGFADSVDLEGGGIERADIGRLADQEPADDAGPQGRTLVLVDDADRLSTDLADRLAELIDRKAAGFHVIAAATSEEFGSFQSWTKPLRNARVGVLLTPHREDGDLLRVRLPSRRGSELPAGRAYLVNGGAPEMAHIASAGAGTGSAVAPTERATPHGGRDRPEEPDLGDAETDRPRPVPLGAFGPAASTGGGGRGGL